MAEPAQIHEIMMAELELTFACVPTDRTRAIIDGSIVIPGFRIKVLPGEPEHIFRSALRAAEFDLTEMSMSSHITATARGDAPYVAIPVFLSRAFRHSGIYVRTDRGIGRPDDLRGRRIGIPEYQQTAILWVRGLLRDDYGIDVGDVEWHTGGVLWPGQTERTRLSLPPHVRVTPISPTDTLDDLLARGELDAVISTRVPTSFIRPEVPVARLFPDYRSVESEYFKRTGFFPIMHCLAIRRRLAEQHPELPRALFHAFREARDRAIAELSMINAFRVTLPWPAAVLDEVVTLMGQNYWSYGFNRNYRELETMTRYAQEDGLTSERIDPERLFHASTLSLTD